MPTSINIDAHRLAKYLTVAAAQRKRALNKFIQDYGPESSVTAECQAEIAELELAINEVVKAAAAAVGTRKPASSK